MSLQHITSRQNARVKDAVKLRDRRQRERQGRFLIDGARETVRALAAGIEVVEAFLCEARCTSAEAREAVAALRASHAVLATVADEVYGKLAFGDGRDGLVAVARTPRRTLSQLVLPANALIAVLEGIEKPGNIGAVLRSADGAGVDAVILADPRTDLFNPNTIRASLGAVFHANIATASSAEARALLAGRGSTAYAARPGAALDYAAADYRGAAAVVLGSEAAGLSEAWQGPGVTPISLPMLGIADSLNVSATAAVLFYEARRQRGGATAPRGADEARGAATPAMPRPSR
ncbi:MAG TPA: TrmH family RNA methyltransferase [Lacipirellulaceae bacterium]|nr:TrmH family RNA methyltransferase [Lacipirellulaceae bacterium]